MKSIVWRDKDVRIAAMKFPDKKRPALCIIEKCECIVYGYFRNDNESELFIDKLAELVGAKLVGAKMEDKE